MSGFLKAELESFLLRFAVSRIFSFFFKFYKIDFNFLKDFQRLFDRCNMHSKQCESGKMLARKQQVETDLQSMWRWSDSWMCQLLYESGQFKFNQHQRIQSSDETNSCAQHRLCPQSDDAVGALLCQRRNFRSSKNSAFSSGMEWI